MASNDGLPSAEQVRKPIRLELIHIHVERICIEDGPDSPDSDASSPNTDKPYPLDALLGRIGDLAGE